MGFLKKLKKGITKAASLYGKVGGLVGAPGAGIAAKVGAFGAARMKPKMSKGAMGRVLMRANEGGGGHGRAKLAHILLRRRVRPRGRRASPRARRASQAFC